jgi:hypothetical protein
MKKMLPTISLMTSLVVISTMQSVTAIPVKQAPLRHSNSSKLMSESEIAIIKDLNQSCYDIASRSISAEDLAAKFGTPAEKPLNSNEVKPFSKNYKSVHTSVDSDSENPLLVDRINFYPNSGKISIEALKQAFGKHSTPGIIIDSLDFQIVRFKKEVKLKSIRKYCNFYVRFKIDKDYYASRKIVNVRSIKVLIHTENIPLL